MNAMSFFTELEWGVRRVRVKKTGALVWYTPKLLADVAAWTHFTVSAAFATKEPGAPFTVAFWPDRAAPWYLIWPVLAMAGGRIVSDPAGADVVFQFDDQSTSEPVPYRGAHNVNLSALDIRKSTVSAAFEAAFGYGLSVDPETHVGPAVEKSERNGAHDGRIVTCPTRRRPGFVYQRVIDNRCAARPGLVEDIRTPTVGGAPALVYLKRRPVDDRFSNTNAEVVYVKDVSSVLTADELDRIADFCDRLSLQWGGLDILRDASDGRIYIVDANKTDMGPPLALSFRDKMNSTRVLAQRLRAFITAPMRGS